MVMAMVADNIVEVTCEAGGKLRQQSWVCDGQEKFSRSSTGTNIAKGSLPGASNKVSNEMVGRSSSYGFEHFVSEYDVNCDHWSGSQALEEIKYILKNGNENDFNDLDLKLGFLLTLEEMENTVWNMGMIWILLTGWRTLGEI